MNDVMFLDKMLTPKIITVVYWLLLLGVVVSGLGVMFSDFGFGRFFGGLLSIIGGAIGVRIFCELLIVLFRMNEALQEIRSK